ncbi:single-pass membrane and coiled-coil domain-containing protein 3-like [Protopterus annectens]|uniref:single-pass membrane and coiled-coil domain-containing protein 3-like n=1 Tax=Protopterus annectens TaxID=7888 RepID=UPI001CFB82B7|nr:single-pass membrane and coiled-coil domain-containing protein 3-like [Protopterus annectens]
MALSDLMFRDNERKRTHAIRLHQEIVLCIERNFNTTNKVSDICNMYLKTRFRHIEMKASDNLEENCDILKRQLSSIQKCFTEMDQHLRDTLEPDVYNLVCDVSVSVSEKQHKLSKYMKKLEGISTYSVIVAGILFPTLGFILCNTVACVTKLTACLIGGLPVLAVFGVALVISYFSGKKQSEALDEAINEYEKVKSDLKPNTDRYQFEVMKACIKLDIPWEK